jgi:UDPglucose 6-dehydrogenase
MHESSCFEALGAPVDRYRPVAPERTRGSAGVNLVGSLREVARTKITVLVTLWAEFSQLAGLLNELDLRLLVVDGRRVLNPESFAHYEGIGR